MRIAVLTNAFPPDARGGAGQIASDLASLWREDGTEIRVWTERAAWTKKHALYRLIGHLFLERVRPACLTELADWNPDVVVTHNLTGSGLLAVGRWFGARNIPWIHVLHDVQLFEPSGCIYTDAVTWWQRAWSQYRRVFFGTPTLVISPTRWLLEAHHARGWFTQVPSRVIVNPAPTRSAKVSSKQDSWLFVGRLDAAKGADVLLEVARACPQEAFLVIGEGPLREWLAREPNVRCVGQQSRAEVLTALSHAEGVLVPSKVHENQPTVILEAFAYGVPVITSCVGGIPETVEKAGLVLPLETARWVETLSLVREQKSALQEASRQQYANFSRERVMDGWRQVFQELLRGQTQTR